MRMCICVYTCAYTCIRKCICSICLRMYMSMYMCMFMYIERHRYRYMYMYEYMYAYIHVYTCIHMNLRHVHARPHACISAPTVTSTSLSFRTLLQALYLLTKISELSSGVSRILPAEQLSCLALVFGRMSTSSETRRGGAIYISIPKIDMRCIST